MVQLPKRLLSLRVFSSRCAFSLLLFSIRGGEVSPSGLRRVGVPGDSGSTGRLRFFVWLADEFSFSATGLLLRRGKFICAAQIAGEQTGEVKKTKLEEVVQRTIKAYC